MVVAVTSVRRTAVESETASVRQDTEPTEVERVKVYTHTYTFIHTHAHMHVRTYT